MARIENILLSETEVGPPLPLDPEYKPSAQIVELPAAATVEEVIQILDRDGGVILADLVSQDDVASIEKDTTSNLGNPDDRKGFEGFIPKETILVGGLVGKSKIIEKLCLHPLLKGLRDEILTDKTYTIREDTRNPVQIDPLLSISLSFRIQYGAPRQRLHRDDVIHLIDHSPPFELRKVSQFACLVAGVETTRENGATMFVPGSHRWDDLRKPRLDEVAFAEMKPGSALIFLAGSYHGGGHNSVPGCTRVVHGLFFCRGKYRTEENQFLAVPHQKVLAMSEEMQALLGYKKSMGTALGLVENNDPILDLEGVFSRV